VKKVNFQRSIPMKSFFIFIAIEKLHRCLNVQPGYGRNDRVMRPSDCNTGTILMTNETRDRFDMDLVEYSERPFVASEKVRRSAFAKATADDVRENRLRPWLRTVEE
jgi:hypothetical protein